MVLLARRALQERLTNKHREGAGGEGVEEGSIVTVMGGRHFPSFSAGDVGEVVKVDREALNCDVLFEGATQAVPVALRHLKLGRNDAPLNASATMAAALRVGSPSRRPTSGEGTTKWRREDDEWEEIAAAMEAKALADARVEAANARAAEAERRALALERQAEANGALAKAAMAVAAEGSNSSLGNGVKSHSSGLGTTYAPVRPSTDPSTAKSNAEDALSTSDQMYTSAMLLGGSADSLSPGGGDAPEDWATVESPRRLANGSNSLLVAAEAAVVTINDTAFTFDGTVKASASDSNGNQVLSKEHDVRVEALESRLAALEERHRAEVASLRSALEDAIAFGKQQEARAVSLEQRLRSGQHLQADAASSSISLPTGGSDGLVRGHSVTVTSGAGRLAASALSASSEGVRAPLTPTTSVPIAPGSWPSAPLSARRVPRTSGGSVTTPHLSAAPSSVWQQVQPRQAVSLPEAPRRLSSSPSCSTPLGQRPSTPTRVATTHSSITESASVTAPSDVPLISAESSVRRSLSASVASRSSTGAASPRQMFLVANPSMSGQPLTTASLTRLRPSSQGPPGSSAFTGLAGSCNISTPGRHSGGASHTSTPAVRSSPAGLNTMPSFSNLDASSFGVSLIS